jgi:hypothetical protein
MYLIPITRTLRSVAMYTLMPLAPLKTITISEILSYSFPFFCYSPLTPVNDMILFLFYYYYYNESAVELINKNKKKNSLYFQLESIIISIYLLYYVSEIVK